MHMLSLLFLWLRGGTIRNTGPYISQVLNYFSRNVLPVLLFANFQREVPKVTKSCKAVEIKIINVFYEVFL